MNYATIIEEELRRIYDRASKLKIALEVINEFRVDVRSQAVVDPDQVQIMHKRAPKTDIKRRNFGPNMYRRTTEQVLAVLSAQTEPIRKKQIDMGVREHMEVSDNLLWKVVRDLRDNGTLTWDEGTRLYSLNRAQPQVKRTA